jgi:lysozyme
MRATSWPPTPGKALGWVAALVGAVLALGAAGAWFGILHLPYPTRDSLPIHGVDVSHYQGRVNWDRIRAAGFEFAFVKASEGQTYSDPEFERLATGARRAGLRVGAYHYFTFCTDGAAQARQFLAATGGPVPGDLPPVVDLEFGGNCSRRPSPADLDGQYAAFEAIVRSAYGRSPVLYVTKEFNDRYLTGASARNSALAGRQLWIRSLVGRPAGGCERWTFWQYADRGRVDGVPGAVDLNAYCGNRRSFVRDFG